MMKARAHVQPGWGVAPNYGRPHNEASRSERSIARYSSQSGEGDGATPTLMGVEGSKAMVADARVQGSGDGGADHHDDRGSGGVG
jgi:hypothetical protein